MADDKSKDKEAQKNEGSDEDLGKAKKKRLIIIGAAAGVAVIGIGAGAALFLGKDKKEAAGETVHADGAAHDDHKTDDGHGGAKKDDHGEAKKDDHGEAKKDGHGEAKKDDHGEAKKDDHGEAKKDDHGEAKKDDHGEAKKDDHGDGHGKADAHKPAKVEEVQLADFGQTFSLNTFHLNLGNPLENRYVRLEVSVEYRGGDAQKSELSQRTPQLRDAVVSIVSRKTREFLLSPDGKDQLRKEILTRINRYMTKPVESVYITDILIE